MMHMGEQGAYGIQAVGPDPTALNHTLAGLQIRASTDSLQLNQARSGHNDNNNNTATII